MAYTLFKEIDKLKKILTENKRLKDHIQYLDQTYGNKPPKRIEVFIQDIDKETVVRAHIDRDFVRDDGTLVITASL